MKLFLKQLEGNFEIYYFPNPIFKVEKLIYTYIYFTPDPHNYLVTVVS